MKSNMIFQKALLLLDKNEAVRGEATLRDAIRMAAEEKDQVTEMQAMCALGDLLCELDRRDEAVPFLQRVASVSRRDDVLDYEIKRAIELLGPTRA